MEAKLAKAGAEVHQQMEETKKHLTNMHGESKEQFLQWFAEAQKKVEGECVYSVYCIWRYFHED